MPFFLTATISMLIVLGFMVLVHELGHFIAAKFFGVRVEVFSIGFGPRLFGVRYGDTDYRIAALPLGGYVKMSGEMSFEPPEEGAEEKPLEPWDFSAKPRWQRIIIGFAGPFANFALAFGLMTGLYMMHNEVPRFLSQPAVVDFVPAHTPAAKAGLEPGDRFVHFDGAPQNPTWNQVRIRAALDANSTIPVTVARTVNGKTQEIRTHLFVFDPTKGQNFRLKTDGLIPRMQSGPLKVDKVESNSPAAKAGLKAGDELAAINGIQVHSAASVVTMLKQIGAHPVELTVLRNGKTLHMTATPSKGNLGDGKIGYRLGFLTTAPPIKVEQLPFLAALHQSAVSNLRYSGYILDFLHRLITHHAEIQQLSGPIGIAQQTGKAVEQASWQPIIGLTAAISLNLGILNLLPIPILDGGMITLLLIEGIMRRDLKDEIKERLYQVAFIMLVLFFAFVMFNDVAKLDIIQKLKP